MSSLSDADRQALLQLARAAVTEAVSHQRLADRIPNHGIFAERRAVFVTLHVQRRLHGCIGVIEGQERLGESVVRCAASAALQDPRFPPLRPEQLQTLQIEISLLSPPFLRRPDEIEIGRHGVLVVRGRQRGLLLPQVAAEHHFTREQFLQEACRKAGLEAETWREPDTQVFGFTCEVFSEGAGLAKP